MTKNLNYFLDQQRIPKPSSNLSARIIAAAAIKKDTPLWSIVLQEVGAMIYIPKPAYALAFSLILGLILGLQSEVYQAFLITDQIGVDAQNVFSFMKENTDLTEGDWL